MTNNVGNVDKIVRGVIALAALIGAFSAGLTTVWGIVLLVVAVIAAVTALIGFCPLYRLFGISTHHAE